MEAVLFCVLISSLYAAVNLRHNSGMLILLSSLWMILAAGILIYEKTTDKENHRPEKTSPAKQGLSSHKSLSSSYQQEIYQYGYQSKTLQHQPSTSRSRSR